MTESIILKRSEGRMVAGSVPLVYVVGTAVAIAAAGAIIPSLVASVLILSLMTQAVIGAILATGVGFLFRQNGAKSFGHAAFYGSAGYIIGLLIRHDLLSVELAILAAITLPAIIAFLIGLVIVRIPGVAFAMLTLAVGQALYEFALKARHITGGDDGFAVRFPSEIFGLSLRMFQAPTSMFVICWIILTVVILGLHFLANSPFGRLTAAIRENEERARFIGYQTLVPRAIIYAVSAFIASIAGVLAALYNGFVSPDILHWTLSGAALIMAIVGGTKYLWGPALGAVVFFFVKDFAGDLTEHWPAIIGLLVIFMTLKVPTGVSGLLVALVAWLRPQRAAVEEAR